MKENIKIGLLTIIAATLVINTFLENKDNDSSFSKRTDANIPISNVAANPSNNSMPPDITEPVIPNAPLTNIKFEKEEHDFGKVKQDTQNKFKFKFKNTGTNPLIIENAVGSCGCTVPTYSTQPIEPGGTGEIEVVYSPGKQKGQQQKTVTVTANTEPKETRVQIKAEVEE